MGKMKQLYIDIQNSVKFNEASEDQKERMIKEWWETDEYKKLKEKLNQNKDD